MRLIDVLLGRYRTLGYNEYMASGASYVMEQTYGPNNRVNELPPPNFQTCKMIYEQNGIVFAAILARMQLFSEVQFVFQDETTGKLEELPPRAKILEHPWEGGTTGDLLARMIMDIDLAGNAYIYQPEPGTLVRLAPEQTSIVREEKTDSQGRKYYTLAGYWMDPQPTGMGDLPSDKAQYYTPDEVAHWKPLPDPEAKFRGWSWLSPIIKDISADQSLTEYKMRFMAQAATPNMIFQYKQRLQKETIDAVRERMQARYGGVDNAFKTLVLDQGASVQVVGNNFQQLSFVDVQSAGENRILMAAGVPPIVVGAKEGLQAATYSNYQLAMRRFADMTIDPLWRSVCGIFDKTIVNSPDGKRLWYDPRNIPALQQNAVEKAQAMQITAAAIASLARYNFEPQSVVDYMASGDVTLLKLAPPGKGFIEIPAAVPLDRPVIEHQGPNIPAPKAPGQLPGQAPVPGPPANKPVAGQIGPTGGTSKAGPNGKTQPSAAAK